MPVDSKKPTPLFVSNSAKKSPNLRLEAMVNTNPSFRRFIKEAIHSSDDWKSELKDWNHTHPTQTIGESEFEAYLAHEKQQLGLHTVFTTKPPMPTLQKPVSLSQISTPKEYRAWIENHYTLQERRMLGFADSDILQKKNRFAHLFSQITHFIPEEDVERLLKQSESAKNDGEMYQQYIYWRDHLNPKFQRLFPDDLFVGFRNWNRMKHQLPEVPLEKEVENKIIQAVEKMHEEKEKEKEDKKKKEEPREERSAQQKKGEEIPPQVHIIEAAPVETTPDLRRAETVYIPVPLPSNLALVEDTHPSQPIESPHEELNPPLTQSFQQETVPPSSPSQKEDDSHSSIIQKIKKARKLYNRIKKTKELYDKFKGGERNISKLFGKGESQAGRSGGKLLQKAIRPVGRVLGKGLGRLGLMGGGGGTAAAGGVGAAAGTGAVAGGSAVTTGVVASSPIWIPIVLLILGILLVIFFIVIWIFIIFFMDDDKLATIILRKEADKQQVPNPEDSLTPGDTNITFTISASHDESAQIKIYDDIPQNADFVSATGTYTAYDGNGKVVLDPKSNPASVRRVVWQFSGDGRLPVFADKPAGWPTSGTLTQGPRGGASHNAIITGGSAGEAVDIANFIATPIYATFDGVAKVVEFACGDCNGPGTGYGNHIILSDLEKTIEVFYGHMQPGSAMVAPGGEVKRGDVIGYMGNTGYSFGSHLHYEFRQISLAPPHIPESIEPSNCDTPGIPCSPASVTYTVVQPEIKAEEGYWFLLHRSRDGGKQPSEELYKGAYGDKTRSKLIRTSVVNPGVAGKSPTPLPSLAGVSYWTVTAKKINPEGDPKNTLGPYFLAFDIPYANQFNGPLNYKECGADGASQCFWPEPGEFGLHGVGNVPSRLTDVGSSGCVRHSNDAITEIYNLLKNEKEEIRYYIIND